MSRKAPVSGDPKSVLIAAKLPAAAITTVAMLRSVPADQMHRQDAHSAADGDERSFGPEHGPAGEGGEGRDDDAGKLDRRDWHRRA